MARGAFHPKYATSRRLPHDCHTIATAEQLTFERKEARLPTIATRLPLQKTEEMKHTWERSLGTTCHVTCLVPGMRNVPFYI